VPGTEVLSIIRVLRVLRIFRILKLGQYLGEADLLLQALLASRRKIGLFLFFIMNVVVILGSFMYLIEGEQSGFDSIPRAVYWAIVTLTTVGYGDISPTTNLGQAIASIVMIMGYCTLAIPTGVVSTALASAAHQKAIDASSPNEGPPTPETAPLEPCHACGHLCLKAKDRFCSQCGTALGLAQDTRP